ncbi:MAG: hypothetical protein ABI321_10580 [Polyangia bacterium]
MIDKFERARALVAPYRERPGVVGAYLAGSSIRPYADEHSDLDLYVVYDDDAFEKLPLPERYAVTFSSDDPSKKDVEIVCISLARLEAEALTRCDGLRAMRQHAVVFFDLKGGLDDLLARIGHLPEDERVPRMRIHYRELLWSEAKAKKARQRGALANARLLEAAALECVWRMLVVAAGQRPTRPDWATQELRVADVPEALVAQWESAVTSQSPALEPLREAVETWLSSLGHTFHRDAFELFRWIAFTAEGSAARERYAHVL